MYWIIGLTILGLIITACFCFSITKEEHIHQIKAVKLTDPKE